MLYRMKTQLYILTPAKPLNLTGEALDQDGDILSSVFCKLERNSVLVWEQTWSPEFWSFDLSQIVIPAFTESGDMFLPFSLLRTKISNIGRH